jgi:mannitol/fructose-specific phosphotransferase system IIA component (Ntr-type)
MGGATPPAWSMSLAELIQEDCVLLDIPNAEKEDLIRGMVDALVRAGRVSDPGPVVHALLERERVMSTGIGGGVAIPHAQCAGVPTLAVVLARPSQGVGFDSLDEKPVRLVFMIVGPEERGGFIRVLARISRLLYSGDLQARLLEARTPADIRRIISEEEEKLRG